MPEPKTSPTPKNPDTTDLPPEDKAAQERPPVIDQNPAQEDDLETILPTLSTEHIFQRLLEINGELKKLQSYSNEEVTTWLVTQKTLPKKLGQLVTELKKQQLSSNIEYTIEEMTFFAVSHLIPRIANNKSFISAVENKKALDEKSQTTIDWINLCQIHSAPSQYSFTLIGLGGLNNYHFIYNLLQYINLDTNATMYLLEAAAESNRLETLKAVLDFIHIDQLPRNTEVTSVFKYHLIPEIAQLSAGYNAEVNIHDARKGMTKALFMALQNNHTDSIKKLLEKPEFIDFDFKDTKTYKSLTILILEFYLSHLHGTDYKLSNICNNPIKNCSSLVNVVNHETYKKLRIDQQARHAPSDLLAIVFRNLALQELSPNDTSHQKLNQYLLDNYINDMMAEQKESDPEDHELMITSFNIALENAAKCEKFEIVKQLLNLAPKKLSINQKTSTAFYLIIDSPSYFDENHILAAISAPQLRDVSNYTLEQLLKTKPEIEHKIISHFLHVLPANYSNPACATTPFKKRAALFKSIIQNIPADMKAGGTITFPDDPNINKLLTLKLRMTDLKLDIDWGSKFPLRQSRIAFFNKTASLQEHLLNMATTNPNKFDQICSATSADELRIALGVHANWQPSSSAQTTSTKIFAMAKTQKK